MSVLHVDYGRVWHFEEPETDEDIRVSPALELLIEKGIADIEHGIEWDRDGDDFRIELVGPWQGSDYSGDDVCESNQRSLARDYPELLIDGTRYCGHSPYGLQITPDFGSDPETADLAMDLAETLIGLRYDYPLYDESDHSELIDERAQQAWDGYLRSDLESEIGDLLGFTVDLCTDKAKDLFWEICYEREIWPEAEGHRDVVLRGVGDREFLLDMARRVLDEQGPEYPDLCYDLTDDGYEVLGAYMAETYEWVHPNQLTII